MKISEELKHFLESRDIQKLLNSYDFEGLYKKLLQMNIAKDIGTFTALMYEIDVDPLIYLDKIPTYFLYDQSSISDIKIPDNIKYINRCAFYKCNSLTDVAIPDSVISIGNLAFSECDGLKTVTLPSGITSIGVGMFYNCNSLADVTIPNRVTSIGDFAFSDCAALTGIIIPDSVKSIGIQAFCNCGKLTSVTIGTGVTSIDRNVLDECEKLEAINYRGTKAQWNAIHKNAQWKNNPTIKVVHCTDGDIKL